MTLNGFLRFTMKRHGKKSIDLARLRLTTDNPPRMALAIPAGLTIDSIKTEPGLQFDLVRASGVLPSKSPTIALYLHGGGYLFGSTKTHRQVLIAMAKAFASPVYGLDYRLAPEHPFPAAFEDAVQAYRWILTQHPAANIALAGDSAGAGLAIASALGVEVELIVRDRLPHVWLVFISLLPEARDAFAVVKAFARRIGVSND